MTVRMRNPADAVKYYTDLINEERVKLEEALAAITEYAKRLQQVTAETHQRLLTRD